MSSGCSFGGGSIADARGKARAEAGTTLFGCTQTLRERSAPPPEPKQNKGNLGSRRLALILRGGLPPSVLFSKVHTMPSKENVVVVQDTVSPDSAGFVYAAADVAVEELVAAIKQNLRLKSRSCHPYCAKSKRMSPYDVPSRTSSCVKDPFQCCGQCQCRSSNSTVKTKETADDPYELLQELLRQGSLIKEAVKRLQFGLATPKQQTDYYDCSDCEVSSSESRTLDL